MTDRIVRWSEVRPGDLVLIEDALVTAERVEVYQDAWGDGATFTRVDVFSHLENGVLVMNERHGDRFTAVRQPLKETSDAPVDRWQALRDYLDFCAKRAAEDADAWAGHPQIGPRLEAKAEAYRSMRARMTELEGQ